MDRLTIVNSMLATQGEDAINSITSPHPDLGKCLRTIDRIRKEVLSVGWQFNTELLNLAPSAADNCIYLPGDFLEAIVLDSCGVQDRTVTTRGKRLYNTQGGYYTFDTARNVYLVRDVPIEDLSEITGTAIHDRAVWWYQLTYDGDSTKSRTLEALARGSFIELNKREIRAIAHNMLDNNPTLWRLRNAYRRPRSSGSDQFIWGN